MSVVNDATVRWVAALIGTPAALLAVSQVPSAVITSYNAVKDAIERSRRWSVDGLLTEAVRRNPLQVELYIRTITTISRNEVLFALRNGFSRDQIVSMVLSSRQAFNVCQGMIEMKLRKDVAKASSAFSIIGFNCQPIRVLRFIVNKMVCQGIQELSEAKRFDPALCENCLPSELPVTKGCETFLDESQGVLVIYSKSPGTISTISFNEDCIITRTTQKGTNNCEALSDFFKFIDRTKNSGANVLQRASVYLRYAYVDSDFEFLAEQALIVFQVYANLKASILKEIELVEKGDDLIMFYSKRERQQLHIETEQDGPIHRRNAIHDFVFQNVTSDETFADYALMAEGGITHLSRLGFMLEESALTSDINETLPKHKATKEFGLRQLVLLRRTSGQVMMEDPSDGASARFFYRLESEDLSGVLAQAQGRLFCYPHQPVDSVIMQPDVQLTITKDRHALSTLGLFVSNAADDLNDGMWRESWIDAVDKMIIAVKKGFGEVERVTLALLRRMNRSHFYCSVKDIERVSRWISGRYGCSWEWLVRENVALRVSLGICASRQRHVQNKSSFAAVHELEFGMTTDEDAPALEFEVGVPLDGCLAKPTKDGDVFFNVRDDCKLAIEVNDITWTAYDMKSAEQELNCRSKVKIGVCSQGISLPSLEYITVQKLRAE